MDAEDILFDSLKKKKKKTRSSEEQTYESQSLS
jgi:nitrogen fixation-related uncharacterized protein